MESNNRVVTASPPLVALSAWILPGAGYWLLGQRGRALVAGVPIIVLFITGLLIAGVRVVEVPGYDVASGKRVMYPILDAANRIVDRQWVLSAAPLSEIRDKPWSVPQVMTGPIAVAAGAGSVYAAGVDPSAPGGQMGVLTHSKINEVGSLYLSVAGLLNLMVIIDSAWRASRISEEHAGIP